MKKLILYLFLALAPVGLQAQEVVPAVAPQSSQIAFGYFSYKAVMEQMPDYSIAQRNVADLRAKYDAEMKRVENEFNEKYEQFLEGQRDFAPSILQKRQAELQELMEKNIAFKEKAQELLKKAEADAYAPIKAKIEAAVKRVGQAHQFAFIVNTDGDSLPYINPSQGMDVTSNILAAAK
jgi:outer membrane protein